jgi:hypothetical protein
MIERVALIGCFAYGAGLGIVLRFLRQCNRPAEKREAIAARWQAAMTAGRTELGATVAPDFRVWEQEFAE